MWEFLQTYGIWILIGISFLLMMRMHSGGKHGGGGCGMGMGDEQHNEPSDRQRVVPLRDEYADTQRIVPLDDQYSDAQRRTLVREITAEGDSATTERHPTKRHSGC